MKMFTKTKNFILASLTIILSIKHVYCAIPDYPWMHFKPYGSTVHLKPLFDNIQCVTESECNWLLPDKTTHLNYPPKSRNLQKYSISSNGTLTIVDIQPNDNGIYHFFIKINGTQSVSKALLNLHGAPFDSLWAEYWPNVVGGLVAMAAVFITFGLIMLADKYRYRPAPIASTRRVSRRPGSVAPYIEPTVVEHANPVFMNDVEDDAGTNENTAHSRRSSANGQTAELRVEHL